MKSVTLTEAWSGVADCRNCAIRQSVLFAGLSEADFDSIHRPIEQFKFAAGSRIYGAEDAAAWIFTVRSGLVKLTQVLPDGTQRIVRLLGGSDSFGLEALLLDRFEHEATALHTTEVCRIPRAVVRDLLTRRSHLFNELMARWHRALGDSDRMITDFNTGPARQRVVRLLLWLTGRAGGDRCDLFSREDLGALLGLTTETVSRTMADLKRRKCISEPRANHFLCDLPSLRRLIA